MSALNWIHLPLNIRLSTVTHAKLQFHSCWLILEWRRVTLAIFDLQHPHCSHVQLVFTWLAVGQPAVHRRSLDGLGSNHELVLWPSQFWRPFFWLFIVLTFLMTSRNLSIYILAMNVTQKMSFFMLEICFARISPPWEIRSLGCNRRECSEKVRIALRPLEYSPTAMGEWVATPTKPNCIRRCWFLGETRSIFSHVKL